MGRAGKKVCNVRSVLARVEQEQEKYDERCLEKSRARNLVIGDWVRTRLWQGTWKGLSKWSEPKQVVKVRKYSVVLNDGKKWNMVDAKENATENLLQDKMHPMVTSSRILSELPPVDEESGKELWARTVQEDEDRLRLRTKRCGCGPVKMVKREGQNAEVPEARA
ncbi:hypothetical protein NDU88_008230 [Pleurodeles waltl]|uniref:Uncharacterized protein n=1 Tax=Pleurodeles waltl TaxID=8319 RepID=A0AAV7NYQ0_PLEWA|nr:hypothetical protein NDU88_008230 [Pleurodeles waltl]